MASSILLYALVAASFSSVRAHLQVASPFPYHSSLNPLTPEASKDYSMTAPLVSNGLPFPCKGYIGTTGEGANQQWAAGQTVDVEIAGTAVHGGGSCQYSLSYDNGVNFYVISSIIGGCNLDTKSFQVKIPDNAPAADNVIFAWTWMNKLGNREMYMNCLSADITSSTTTPLSGPTIFVANAAVNQCSTVEGTPVVFPSPGSVVTYGGEYAGLSIGNGLTSGAGVVGTDCYAPGSAGAGGAVVVAPTTKAATTKAATTAAATTKAATTSTKAAVTISSSVAAAVTSVKASSAVVAIVLPTTSSTVKSVAPATTVKTSSSSTKAAATSKATTSSFLSVVTKASSPVVVKVTSSTKAVTPTTSSKAVAATTTTRAAAAAATTKAAAVKCTTGEWKCVGQVLTQCANDTWYSMADCVLQTGTVCSASTPIGCVWPFQVASGRKRHVGGHGKKRMLPSTPKLGAIVA